MCDETVLIQGRHCKCEMCDKSNNHSALLYPHISHWKGLSPVCIFMCIFYFVLISLFSIDNSQYISQYKIKRTDGKQFFMGHRYIRIFHIEKASLLYVLSCAFFRYFQLTIHSTFISANFWRGHRYKREVGEVLHMVSTEVKDHHHTKFG